MTEEDRERRLNTLYFPYHQAIDSFLEHSPSSLIFSIHSYTDQYEGTKRDVEAGLLFIEDETLAQKVLNIPFIILLSHFMILIFLSHFIYFILFLFSYYLFLLFYFFF